MKEAEYISISNQFVGKEHKPFIIAEMSGNHNQNIQRALEIVDAASESGASAIKLQTYTPDSLTLNLRGGDFEIKDKSSLWRGENLYDLYKKAYTPWDWHKAIFNRARKKNLICFSSPFCEEAVDFLEDLDVPAYKIASFENNHIPLIRKAASTGKPLIISTGLASLGELEQAVITARNSGCKELILLKCTSTYPASPKETNISTIKHLRKLLIAKLGYLIIHLGLEYQLQQLLLGQVLLKSTLLYLELKAELIVNFQWSRMNSVN